MIATSVTTIIEKIIDKILYEPLEKIKQILKLTMQILICLIIVMVIPLIFLIIMVCYFSFIYIKTNFNQYEKLIQILHNVKCNHVSNFMNYGYWDKKNMNLLKANKRMCKIIEKKGELHKAKNVLDVGCGYGEQDFYWSKNLENLQIDAVDLNEVSINHAKKDNEKRKTNINFSLGNACKLNSSDNKYDRVISLESAFHYSPRTDFLKESHRVLKKGGKLIIADILYNNEENVNIFNYYNCRAFEKVFNIPDSNKITIDKFKSQLRDIGFKVKLEDITDYTFKPYYKYFFENVEYSKDMIIPIWTFNLIKKVVSFYINDICAGTNGFKYVIAVCEKI